MLSTEESELIAEIRRNQRLVIAYDGARPADRMLRDDIEAGFRALVSGNIADMRNITSRMKGNLPPVKRQISAKAARRHYPKELMPA